MPITLRFRGVPPALQARLRETIENALEGEWTVTLSQSHLDGQWHLQLDGAGERYRVVLPALQNVRATGLQHLLRQLVERDPGSKSPAPDSSTAPAAEGDLR